MNYAQIHRQTGALAIGTALALRCRIRKAA
jgi:hypothetical protein